MAEDHTLGKKKWGTRVEGDTSRSDTASIQVGTSFYRQLYLFGFATQPEIRQYLRTQAAAEELGRLPEIYKAWTDARATVDGLLGHEQGIAETIAIEDLPSGHEKRLAPLLKDDLIGKAFSLPWSVQVVEIDKLVAAQRTVNLEHVDRLKKRIGSNPTMADLIDICLSPKGAAPPIQHLELGLNLHAFSSPSSDLRFLGSFLKTLTADDEQYAEMGGTPAAAIISFVGYGAAPVNVIWSGSRVVLNNGFHRVYALRELGVTKIPVIFQQATNVQLEFPPQVAGLPREYLLMFPRPVLIKDFFENGLTTVLKVKNRLRVVTLQNQAGQHDVPS